MLKKWNVRSKASSGNILRSFCTANSNTAKMNLQDKNRLVLWNLPPPAVVKWYKTDLDWYKPDPVDLRNRGTTARERTLVCITDRAWVCMARKFFLKSPTPSIRPRELIGLYKTTETPQGTKRRRPKKPQLRDQMPIVSVNPEAR